MLHGLESDSWLHWEQHIFNICKKTAGQFEEELKSRMMSPSSLSFSHYHNVFLEILKYFCPTERKNFNFKHNPSCPVLSEKKIWRYEKKSENNWNIYKK